MTGMGCCDVQCALNVLPGSACGAAIPSAAAAAAAAAAAVAEWQRRAAAPHRHGAHPRTRCPPPTHTHSRLRGRRRRGVGAGRVERGEVTFSIPAHTERTRTGEAPEVLQQHRPAAPHRLEPLGPGGTGHWRGRGAGVSCSPWPPPPDPQSPRNPRERGSASAGQSVVHMADRAWPSREAL
eukprot:gene25720-biopygen10539